jgi:hypothetical protein
MSTPRGDGPSPSRRRHARRTRYPDLAPGRAGRRITAHDPDDVSIEIEGALDPDRWGEWADDARIGLRTTVADLPTFRIYPLDGPNVPPLLALMEGRAS